MTRRNVVNLTTDKALHRKRSRELQDIRTEFGKQLFYKYSASYFIYVLTPNIYCECKYIAFKVKVKVILEQVTEAQRGE